MHPRTLRATRSATLVTVVLPLLCVTVAASPASADERDDHRYDLKGTGYSQLYEAMNPSLPASPSYSAASLAASSELTSNDASFAFAAAPYYGSTVTYSPALANGLLPGLIGTDAVAVPITNLPGIVDARYPSHSTGHEDGGGYRVDAESTEFASSSRGDNGSPAKVSSDQQQVASSDTHANSDGSTSVTVHARTNGVSLGALEGISAGSDVTLTDAGGKPVLKSVSQGSFTAMGVKVAFDDKGFSVPGMSTVDSTAFLKQLNTVLASAGTKIETKLATKTVDDQGDITFTTAALRVTTTRNLPETGVGGLTPGVEIPVYGGGVPALTGDATAVYTFGFAKVISGNERFASSAAVPPVRGSSSSSPASTTGTSSSVGGSSPTGGAAVDPAAFDSPSATSTGTGPSSAGLSSVVDSSADRPRSVSNSRPDALGFAPTDALRSENTQLLYLVLVLGGFSLVIGQQLFSRFGLRLALATHDD